MPLPPGTRPSGGASPSVGTVAAAQVVAATGTPRSPAFAIADAANNVLFAAYEDGEITGLATLAASVAALEATGSLLTTEDTASIEGAAVDFAVVDQAGNVLLAFYSDGTSTIDELPEIVAARGAESSIDARLSKTLADSGAPKVTIYNAEALKNWHAWAQSPSGSFDIALIGDSFTHGASYWSQKFRDLLLAEGFTDGGPGYCGFSWIGSNYPALRNSSIDNAELDYTLTSSEWANTYGTGGYGPDVGHITSTTANAVISVAVETAIDSLTVLYERHASAGDFRWRIDAGGWTTVSTANATQDVATEVIDTSGAGSSFVVEIEALATGVVLMGVIADKGATNQLRLHKCGSTGGNAGMFAGSALFADSLAALTPKLITVMFGTNEQSGDTPPATMKTNLLAIIDAARDYDPLCDVLVMAPFMTSREASGDYTRDQYAAASFDAALARDAAFVDFGRAFGAYSADMVTAGFVNADTIHPGTQGGRLMTQILKRAFL